MHTVCTCTCIRAIKCSYIIILICIAELDIHKERIAQHVKAVTSGMQLQREVLQNLPEELEKMVGTMYNVHVLISTYPSQCL